MRIKTVHRLAATTAAVAMMCAGLWCLQNKTDSPLSQVAYAEEREPVAENNLVALELITSPLRTEYVQGDNLDVTGLTVAAKSSDNMMHIVPNSDLQITGYDSSVAGKQTITVALKSNAELTTSFTVNVSEHEIAKKVYTIDSLAHSSADGVVKVDNNDVVVDLSKVPSDTTDVTVARNALGDATRSVVFTHGAINGRGLYLNIADWALAQQETPTLTSVVFPDGLNSLKIGRSAFFQYSYDSSATLAYVRFPYSLKTLTIGDSAFRQDVYNDAALKDVNLPEHVDSLRIGSLAFHQKYNRKGALHSVTLPADLLSLRISAQAFSTNPSYGALPSLRSVFLASDEKQIPQKTMLGAFLTRTGSPLHTEVQPVWQYLGEKSTVEKVFSKNAKISPTVAKIALEKGTLLTYDANYGTDLEPVTTMPSSQGLVYDNAKDTQNVAFVAPVRPWHTFLGWNTKADGSGVMFKSGEALSLDHSNAGVVLYAQWKAIEKPKPADPGSKDHATKPSDKAPVTKDESKPVDNKPTMNHKTKTSQLAKHANASKSAMLSRTGAAISAVVVVIILAVGIAAVLFYGRHRSEQHQISHGK